MSNTRIVKTEIEGLRATELLERFESLESKFNTLLERVSPNPEITLLTRKECADMFGVSLVTIHDWSKKGILKSYKVGSKVRYKQSEVLATLETKQTVR